MTRRALNLLTALFLLLCVAVCVLWVRSGMGSDSATWTYFRRDANGGAMADAAELASDRGSLWLTAGSGRLGRPGSVYWDEYYRQADATGGRPRLQLGRYLHTQTPFDSGGGRDRGAAGWGPVHWRRWGQADAAVPVAVRNTRVSLDHWFAAALLALAPAFAAWRRVRGWRQRHARLGLCPTCGYDLRASPERCPECGAFDATSKMHCAHPHPGSRV